METWEIDRHASGGRLLQSGALTPSGSVYDAAGVSLIVNLDTGAEAAGLLRLDAGHQFFGWKIDDGPVPDEHVLWILAVLVAATLRAGRNVLVHCGAGVNRSGLVNACALMLLRGISGPEAVEWVRAKRPGALSNAAFAQYLAGLPTGYTPASWGAG